MKVLLVHSYDIAKHSNKHVMQATRQILKN